MSSTIAPDVTLEVRTGQYPTKRRQRGRVSTSSRVYVDVLDSITKQPVAEFFGAYAAASAPAVDGQDSPSQPLETFPTETGFAFDVTPTVFGTWTLTAGITEPSIETVSIIVDVADIAGVPAGLTIVSYEAVQNIAAAAGASASAEAARAVATIVGAQAGASAGAAVAAPYVAEAQTAAANAGGSAAAAAISAQQAATDSASASAAAAEAEAVRVQVPAVISQISAITDITESAILLPDLRAGTLRSLSDEPVSLTIPPGLAAPVQWALIQQGEGRVSVLGGEGVTIISRLGHTATAGQFAAATLTQVAPDTYLLAGDTAMGAGTALPVVPDVYVTVGSDLPVGELVALMRSASDSGPVAYALAGGSGALAVSGTGQVRTLATLTPGVPAYEADVTGVSPFGTDTGRLRVDVRSADYRPGSAGAACWFSPRLPSTRLLVDTDGDGRQESLGVLYSRLGPSNARLLGTYNAVPASPRPVLGTLDGMEVADFVDPLSRLVISAEALVIYNGATYAGIEIAFVPTSLATIADLARISAGAATKLAVRVLPSRQIQVQTRRLDSDTLVTVATTVLPLSVGVPQYLSVGVNYAAGQIVVDCCGIVQTIAATWASGNGALPAVTPSVGYIGQDAASSNRAAMRLAECALYAAAPTSAQRAANRAALGVTYGIRDYATGSYPPVLQSQSLRVPSAAAVGTEIGQVVADSYSGTPSYAITAGNTSGLFAINATTGLLTVADALGAPGAQYVLTVSATNAAGSGSTTVTATTVADAYDPIASGGAVAWWQPRAAASRVLSDIDGDGRQESILTLLNRAATTGYQLQGNNGVRPLPQRARLNGIEGADFTLSATSALFMSTTLRNAFQNKAYVAFEMVLQPPNVASNRDILRLWTSTTSLLYLSQRANGPVQFAARRLTTDTAFSATTAGRLVAGQPNHLWVSVDGAAGTIRIAINGVEEVFSGTWESGLGSLMPSAAPGSGVVGYGDVSAPLMLLGDLALYFAAPSPAQIAANRAALSATYGVTL